MKSSRFYQNCIQVIGSVGEIVLFLSGFFLGKGMIGAAVGLLIFRMAHKIVISELMYRRSKVVVTEGLEKKNVSIQSNG